MASQRQAPRTSTQVVKVVAEHLLQRGIFIHVYLDDWLKLKALLTEERVAATTGSTGLLLAEMVPARQWTSLLGFIASLTGILFQCKLCTGVIQLHVLSKFNLRKKPLSIPVPSSQKMRKEL